MPELTTSIWKEVPQENNPYVADKAYCHGFDVYSDLLKNADVSDYLLLLIKGEPPANWEKELFRILFIAVANPGPRDASIHAAMCAGVGGSHSAAVLMASLGAGNGHLGGGHELRVLVEAWQEFGCELQSWCQWLSEPVVEPDESPWSDFEYPPGHFPYAESAATPVKQVLELATGLHEKLLCLEFLRENQSEFESSAGKPLSMVAVAAAICADLKLSSRQAEMLYLWARLPGAMVHGEEQRALGYKRFPFFGDRVHWVED